MTPTPPVTFCHAICRRPGADLARGLTTATLGKPDFARALAQHDAYVQALRDSGLNVTVLDAAPGYPDAHFVEDTAVVTPHVAVIARPGHPDRRGEERTIAPVLAEHRPLERIVAPGTLDGGDVLMIGDHFFIGISERTNAAGAAQLTAILARYGHTATTVSVAAGLHFKSSVNELGEVLLLTRDFAGREELADYPHLVVPVGEEYAGNTLRINDHLLTPAGHPGVRQLLESLEREITVLDLSEMRKMDGGLTCLSLRF
jgi:dimethylargininase